MLRVQAWEQNMAIIAEGGPGYQRTTQEGGT